MDRDKLNALTRKDLAQKARQKGIKGWHAMTKVQLVRALVSRSKSASSRSNSRRAAAKPTQPAAPRTRKPARGTTPGSRPKGLTARKAPSNGRRRRVLARGTTVPVDISTPAARDTNGYDRSRIILTVQDPHWIQATWQMSSQGVGRAQAALGSEWHGAKPILRLLDVTSEDTTSSSEVRIGDVAIHGKTANWFINIDDPDRAYRVDIGYLSRKNRFYVLARSNTVRLEHGSTSDEIDENWKHVQEKFQKLADAADSRMGGRRGKDLSELLNGRLRVPLNGGGLDLLDGERAGQAGIDGFGFQMEAELIVYGTTDADAKVALQGEAVKVRNDGTFTMRFSLPEGRQIFPAVAISRDGSQSRTIVLAVERNTKHLEPVGQGNGG